MTRTLIFSISLSFFCTFSSSINAKDDYPVDYLAMDLYSLKTRRWFENGNLPHLPISAPFMRFNPSTVKQFSSPEYSSSSYLLINNPVLFTMLFPFSLFSPAASACSLTAIELAPDSMWRISGYKLNSGTPIAYNDFNQNHELMTAIKAQNMFDFNENSSGRFLLLDQENSWGLFNYPLDANITFSRHNDLTEALEEITVNVKREITNNMKAGKVYSRIISTRGIPENISGYKLVSNISYPNYDFDTWYHQPSRIMIDFKPTGRDKNHFY